MAEDLRSIIESEVLTNCEPLSAVWLARESGHDLASCQRALVAAWESQLSGRLAAAYCVIGEARGASRAEVRLVDAKDLDGVRAQLKRVASATLYCLGPRAAGDSGRMAEAAVAVLGSKLASQRVRLSGEESAAGDVFRGGSLLAVRGDSAIDASRPAFDSAFGARAADAAIASTDVGTFDAFRAEGGEATGKRRTKRVLKEETSMDERGYMVTEQKWVEVPVDSDEEQETAAAAAPKPKQQQPQRKAKAAGRAKPAAKKPAQRSLAAFFGKGK